MATKSDFIPEDFLLHLQKQINDFASEKKEHQLALARMAWSGSTKRRQHQYFAGYATYTHQEIDDAFGRRKFTEINKRLQLFEVTSWSVDLGHTKGYKLSTRALVARDKYLLKNWRDLCTLVYGKGNKLIKPPAAVSSKSMDGMTTTAWKNAKALNRTPVDVYSLKSLRDWLIKTKKDLQEGRVPVSLFTEALPTVEAVDRLITMVSQIIRLSQTSVAGYGYVLHHYVQAPSGRLYAQGINLQTTPTLIKQAALSGLFEYDFANCHFSILDQMAARFGYQCENIRHYLKNKKQTRETIAREVGISVDQAKVCLLAIMYGARASTWHESAIVETVGLESAKRLFALPEFNAIRHDITTAQKHILGGWTRTANGRLTNEFGKSIAATEKPRKQLAHLIQGVEAKALQTAINLYPDSIVLLQHDGFASTSRLDSTRIQHEVRAVTGYDLVLEEERIQLDPDSYFGKYRIKNESPAKPMLARAPGLPLPINVPPPSPSLPPVPPLPSLDP